MIWKHTDRLGCARADNFFTCLYSPGGNKKHEYEKNVLPPTGRKKFGQEKTDFNFCSGMKDLCARPGEVPRGGEREKRKLLHHANHAAPSRGRTEQYQHAVRRTFASPRRDTRMADWDSRLRIKRADPRSRDDRWVLGKDPPPTVDGSSSRLTHSSAGLDEHPTNSAAAKDASQEFSIGEGEDLPHSHHGFFGGGDGAQMAAQSPGVVSNGVAPLVRGGHGAGDTSGQPLGARDTSVAPSLVPEPLGAGDTSVPGSLGAAHSTPERSRNARGQELALAVPNARDHSHKHDPKPSTLAIQNPGPHEVAHDVHRSMTAKKQGGMPRFFPGSAKNIRKDALFGYERKGRLVEKFGTTLATKGRRAGKDGVLDMTRIPDRLPWRAEIPGYFRYSDRALAGGGLDMGVHIDILESKEVGGQKDSVGG